MYRQLGLIKAVLHAVGRARGASAECVLDSEGSPSQLTCQARMGAIHRCSNQRTEQEEEECRLSALGKEC